MTSALPMSAVNNGYADCLEAVHTRLAARESRLFGIAVPYQVYLLLPYAFSIVALVLAARRAAYPQALMKPYRKGER